jgi:hypothetical protein
LRSTGHLAQEVEQMKFETPPADKICAHPLRVFTARAEARALLAHCGVLDLEDAINDLVKDAVASGLLGEVGQPVLESILLAAFTKYAEART